MASGNQDLSQSGGTFTPRTWISSSEVRRLFSSGLSPASPEAVLGNYSLAPPSPLTEDANWFKKVPCCHLKSIDGAGNGQGIIVCFGLDSNRQRLSEILGVSTYPSLALLTNHHIIPCKANAKKWKMSISGMEMKKLTVPLDEKRIDVCRSCCGRDGVIGQSEHPQAPCPVRADFTILVLSRDFASKILENRDLKFPILMPLDVESLKGALQSERFYIFKRDEESGIVRDVELTLHKVQAPTSDDQLSLEGQITAYKQMCLLRYDTNCGVAPGDSGAGIFFKRGTERLLLGLHKSTEQEAACHSGIAVHAIFHPITGSEVCRLIPALSLLKDGKMFKQQRKEFYRNVSICFEPKQGASVQVSEEGDRRREVTLETVLNVLEYILRNELLVLQSGEELTKPSVDLLATIFGYLGKNHCTHDKIKDCIRDIYPNERNRTNFYELVCKAGEEICRLCDPNQNPKIVESCFECWHNLSYFPSPRPVFTDATKMANIKNVRNCDQFKNNLIVQRAFGDICLAYQLHIRCELEIERQRLRMQEEKLMQDREQEIERVRAALQEKDQQEAKLDRQIEEERRKKKEEVEEERRNNEAAINALEATFDKEREDLQKKLKASEDLVVERESAIEQMREEAKRNSDKTEQLEAEVKLLKEKNKKLNVENEQMSRGMIPRPPNRHYSEPTVPTTYTTSSSYSNLYPTRVKVPEDSSLEPFWWRDVGDVLGNDVTLRENVAKCFVKNIGSEGTKTWEHLIDHLQNTKPHFRMSAQQLETHPVAEILLKIVTEWGKIGDKVTVSEFCDVSKKLGIGRVERLFQDKAASEQLQSDYDISEIEQPNNQHSGTFFDFCCEDVEEARV